MSAVDPTTSAPLGYAAPPPWHRRRRFRRAGRVVVLIGLVAAGWRWGPPAWRHVRLLYWQRQCLAYTTPADQVVYDENPVRAATLLKREEYVHHPASAPGRLVAMAREPRCWAEAIRLAPNSNLLPGTAGGCPVFFLHERRSPDGTRRLVIVGGVPGSDIPFLRLIRPAGLLRQPSVCDRVFHFDLDVELSCDVPPPEFRVFAGQADPADPSHFTIRGEMGGTLVSFDGWLKDGDRVDLRIRTCPSIGPGMGQSVAVNESLPVRMTQSVKGTVTYHGQAGSVTGSLKLQGYLAGTVSLHSAPAPSHAAAGRVLADVNMTMSSPGGTPLDLSGRYDLSDGSATAVATTRPSP